MPSLLAKRGGVKFFMEIMLGNFYFRNIFVYISFKRFDVIHITNTFSLSFKKYRSDNLFEEYFIIISIYFDALFKLEENEVLHTILIKGDKTSGLLYSLVEFFSSCSYIVISNDNYDGEEFDCQYSYELYLIKWLIKLLNISSLGLN